MCLNIPHELHSLPFPKTDYQDGFRVGYKMFERIENSLFSSRFLTLNLYLPVNKWLDEKDYRPTPSMSWLSFDCVNKLYRTGFHTIVGVGEDVLERLRETFNNKYIRKVLVKNVTRKGWDNTVITGLPCVVSKHILILPCNDDSDIYEDFEIGKNIMLNYYNERDWLFNQAPEIQQHIMSQLMKWLFVDGPLEDEENEYILEMNSHLLDFIINTPYPFEIMDIYVNFIHQLGRSSLEFKYATNLHFELKKNHRYNGIVESYIQAFKKRKRP